MKYVPQQRLALHAVSTCTCDIPDSLPCEGEANEAASSYFWREREDSIMVPFALAALETPFKEELFKP